MKSMSRPTSLVARDEPLEFQVVPDVGLRNENVEFLLGMPLNQTITMIQQNARILQNIKLSYSKKNPFSRDVCLQLTNDGIKLYFDSITQLLRHIDVDNLSSIVLKYNDKVFSEPGAEASLDRVDEYFGSTHPGAYDDRQKLYVQSWRGLSFCFPNKGNVQVTPGFGPHLLSLKYDGASQPKLTKMSIFKGTAPNKTEPVDMPLACYSGQNRTVCVEAGWDEQGTMNGIHVTFLTQSGGVASSRSSDCDLELVEMTRTINFGDSVSSVLCSLGAPSKVFYKSEDKMSIHRIGGSKQTLSHMPHFFFNYFSMGLDVLFDFATKRVIKFVLHTNLPGHYDFGIYARCEFRITIDGADSMVIDTMSKYTDMISVFHDPSLEQQHPPVVSRRRDEHDPFGSTYLYGTNQLIVEVMDNHHIAAVTLFDADL